MKVRADQRIGLLLAGIIAAVLVALGATVGIPAADPATADLEVPTLEQYHDARCWNC